MLKEGNALHPIGKKPIQVKLWKQTTQKFQKVPETKDKTIALQQVYISNKSHQESLSDDLSCPGEAKTS